jgi:putative transposase
VSVGPHKETLVWLGNPTTKGRDGSPSRPEDDSAPLLRSAPSQGDISRNAQPKRKTPSHDVPFWVPEGSTYFISVNCAVRGPNQLAFPDPAHLLLDSVIMRCSLGHWWPRLFLIMPDHLHGLFVFSPERILKQVVENWKRYVSRHYAISWQRDFFEHRIRDPTELAEKWHYIIENPVRAGLVATAEEWPYVWTAENLYEDKGRDGSPSSPQQ